MGEKIWLALDYVFKNTEWNIAASTVCFSGDQQRAYDIWERANMLVEKNESIFDLTDGITNLKRSINQRLKFIEDIYGFKKISFSSKPKGYLELLETYGIVKPYIIKTIFEIRNLIEHNDSLPPDPERCKELVDMVWYFLKSTDYLIYSVPTDFEFSMFDKNNNGTHYAGTLTLDLAEHKSIGIYGWFPQEVICSGERENFVTMDINGIHGKEKWVNTEFHKDKLNTDLWVSGEVDTERFDYHYLIRYLLTSVK